MEVSNNGGNMRQTILELVKLWLARKVNNSSSSTIVDTNSAPNVMLDSSSFPPLVPNSQHSVMPQDAMREMASASSSAMQADTTSSDDQT